MSIERISFFTTSLQALTTSDERVGGILFLGQRVGGTLFGTLFGWAERKIRVNSVKGSISTTFGATKAQKRLKRG
jgi:hypothetical protein